MARLGDAKGWILAIILGAAGGCQTRESAPKTATPPFQGDKIVVGAVGDPAILHPLNSERGEWVALRGADLTLLEKPVDPGTVKDVDVLFFPGERLGDLVDAGALAALPPTVTQPPSPKAEQPDEREGSEGAAEDALQFSDVAPAFREQVSKYGKDRMALPYGGSALVLVYRRAAFEREANRKAAKEAGIALEPPATWEQLDALARFFRHHAWDGDGAPRAGIALALGADNDELGSATFLARAAGLGQHRDQFSFLFDADSMTPRIDGPPFVEALRALVALKDCGPEGAAEFTADGARKAFREKQVVFLIDRAERASTWGEGPPIGVLPLPGSGRVYDPERGIWETPSPPNQPSYLPFGGGWLAGVAASSQGRRREAAIDFIRYVTGPEISNRIVADRVFPMLPVRTKQLSQGFPDSRSAPAVDARQWSDAVGRTLLAARVVPGLRIPDAGGYLADLTKGRIAAAHGQPADAALHAVAEAWSSRTKKLGTERQLWHYRRSLTNDLATLPEPPPR